MGEVNKVPQFIWLQLYGDSSPDDGPVPDCRQDVSWCWEPIFEHDIKYVLCSDYETLRQQVAELEKKVRAQEVFEASYRSHRTELNQKLSTCKEILETIASYDHEPRHGIDYLWLLKRRIGAMVSWANTALNKINY